VSSSGGSFKNCAKLRKIMTFQACGLQEFEMVKVSFFYKGHRISCFAIHNSPQTSVDVTLCKHSFIEDVHTHHKCRSATGHSR